MLRKNTHLIESFYFLGKESFHNEQIINKFATDNVRTNNILMDLANKLSRKKHEVRYAISP